MSVKELAMNEAIREAIREEMRRDKTIVLIGESIKRASSFGVTTGLIEEFGPDRVWDAPIAENVIIGLSLGAALTGLRPVPEIMLGDFVTYAMDMICNEVAKWRYLFGGNFKVPMVIRVGGCGVGMSLGAQHSQCLEAWFLHVPGLKVVFPSTPYDAKGLLKGALREDNPILFFEHKALYGVKGPVPSGDYIVPLGLADVKKQGKDVTIVAWALMLHKALAAASMLEKEGISAEVVDLRTLYPLDVKTVLESVKKTGRLVIVEEAPRTCGVGAEISAIMNEEGFDYLDAPIKRVTAPHTPIPFSPALERLWVPDVPNIIKAVKEILR